MAKCLVKKLKESVAFDTTYYDFGRYFNSAHLESDFQETPREILNGVWMNQSVSSHIAIPVGNARCVELECDKTNASKIAFVKSYDASTITANSTANLCEGSSLQKGIEGKRLSYVIPDDCSHIIIMVTSVSKRVMPSYVKLQYHGEGFDVTSTFTTVDKVDISNTTVVDAIVKERKMSYKLINKSEDVTIAAFVDSPDKIVTIAVFNSIPSVGSKATDAVTTITETGKATVKVAAGQYLAVFWHSSYNNFGIVKSV